MRQLVTEGKWSNDWRWKIHSNSTISYNGWSPRGLVAPPSGHYDDCTWLDLTSIDLTIPGIPEIFGITYAVWGMGLAFYLEFTSLSKNDKNFPKIGESPFLTSNLLYAPSESQRDIRRLVTRPARALFYYNTGTVHDPWDRVLSSSSPPDGSLVILLLLIYAAGSREVWVR